MSDPDEVSQKSSRGAWNKGKLIGAKPPLLPRHVWSIRTRMQLEGHIRDLAMFNLAIDSKLRGCDVVAIKVEDVAPHGYAVDRATLLTPPLIAVLIALVSWRGSFMILALLSFIWRLLIPD